MNLLSNSRTCARVPTTLHSLHARLLFDGVLLLSGFNHCLMHTRLQVRILLKIYLSE